MQTFVCDVADARAREREVRKIPAKLLTLMLTAFMDMVGLLMIIPLLPFYVKSLGGAGINVLGIHFGIGIITGLIIASFTVAQLVSAPLWGRFSDRMGRRPTLLIALTAAAIATEGPVVVDVRPVVLDVLRDGRIGGVEFLKRI